MASQAEILKPRDLYLKRLLAFQDTEPVKVVTGVRRCGKSFLLKLMMRHLLDSGVAQEQILDMNFESLAYRSLDVSGFYSYVKQRVVPGKRLYLFFDELQRLEGWEDAVNSFRVDFDCDIYVTGSNAHLLSSDFSTYLSGRCVEIKMLPLSFREFIDFHGYEIREQHGLSGEQVKRAYDKQGEQIPLSELFEAYLRYGGMPGLAGVGLKQDVVELMLGSIYTGVVENDIAKRRRADGQLQLADSVLLSKIIRFLADNIGNSTSLSSIGNTLVAEHLLPAQGKDAAQSVAVYVEALLSAYLFYEIKRFDIKGKAELGTLGKYYMVDTGLRNYLLGYRDLDRGHLLENVVYFELLRRGYEVAVGKIGEREIDFIATKGAEKSYFQVTEDLNAEHTRRREIKPLTMIRDNYEKVVLAAHTDSTAPVEGIKIRRVLDFLLQET